MNISSELSNNQEPNQNTQQKSSGILEELKEFIPKGNSKFNFIDKKVTLKKSVMGSIWKNRWLVLILFMMIINLLLIRIFLELNFSDNLIYHAVYGLLFAMVVLSIYFFIQLYRDWKNLILKTWKKSIAIVQSNFDCSNYHTFIKQIGDKYKIEEIKEAEIIFKITSIFKTGSKLLINVIVPIMSIVLIWIFINVIGISATKIQAISKYITLIGISGIGVVTFTVIVFNLLTELICQDLVVYQQCILILQEAYHVAKNKEDEEKFSLISKVYQQNKLILNAIQNIENKKASSSLNKNIKGKNLFKELKNIKITDAPRDLSTSFDFYMNRGESAGTDIH